MSKKNQETSKEFLREYLNGYSPVAQETEGQKIWIDYVKDLVGFSNVKLDAYGTAYAIKFGDQPDLSYRFGERYKVVIEAHCDEIAWIVTYIEKDGFLRVKTHGGSDNMIAPSKTVLVHTHNETKVKGVFGSPAIHVREKRTEMGTEVHDLWIDLGVDSDEKVKELGVEVGNIVTFDTQFDEIGDYYVGRSLDNKIGGYIIAETLKNLKDEKLPYDLYVVNAVQEEVGLFGARLIAQTIKPDIALVHDVCHNTNHPKMNKAKDGDIKGGEGPCLEYTAQNHRKIIKMFKEVASMNEIKLQNTIGSYGNDTVSFFLENIPTAIVASPLKYMHTTVEMVHKSDVEDVIRLFTHTLREITPEWIDSVKYPKIQ
jgi:putative aminopeptidase FrvX